MSDDQKRKVVPRVFRAEMLSFKKALIYLTCHRNDLHKFHPNWPLISFLVADWLPPGPKIVITEYHDGAIATLK